MYPSMELFALGLLLLGTAIAGLHPGGVECGEKRCSTVEYCSPYDKRCKPCSSICDDAGTNHQSPECISDCQEYLHDKRYVLLKQYEDLRDKVKQLESKPCYPIGEIEKLWILVAISISVAFSSLISTLYLLLHKFARWENMRASIGRVFTSNKIKRTPSGNNNSNVNNNNNNNIRQKTQEDAELGTSKHNGLKLTMPTISASVAPSRHLENGNGNGHGHGHGSGSGSGSGSGNGSANGSGSGNGSASGVGNATPNTTSTSLSRRHPSEDTTLDYAYDNPAMTPSPETVQLRTKRESSF